MKKYLLSLALFTALQVNLLAQSQIIVDGTYTAEEMIMDFFDGSIVVPSNVTFQSTAGSFGFFDAGASDLAVNSGIVLSTGMITDIPNAGDVFATSVTQSGTDDDLSLLVSGLGINDATYIAFDFTALTSEVLSFSYVFGSEEYPEFACSSFNDVFGFFVSGPGFDGPFEGDAQNISVLPGTEIPVSINSIHPENGANCPAENEAFYMNNLTGTDVVYDGLTIQMTADFAVVEGETYHAKISLGDAGDSAFDSGVFIGYNSLGNVDSLIPPTEFFLVQSDDHIFEIENESKYARTYDWDFGNGVTSSERNPGPIMYTQAGDYTITLTTTNYCCTNVYSQTINVESIPTLTSTVSNITNLLCHGDQNGAFDFEIAGGIPPYDIVWTPAITNTENLPAGTYSYVLTDSIGSVFLGDVVIEEPAALGLEALISSDMDINFQTIDITPNGGVAPYSYLWSTGDADEDLIVNNEDAVFEVTITDANGCTYTETFEVSFINNTLELTTAGITLYPNPVQNTFVLDNLDLSVVEQIKIYDALGKIVSFTQIGNQISLEAHLSKGLYMLEIIQSDNQVLLGKFLKN